MQTTAKLFKHAFISVVFFKFIMVQKQGQLFDNYISIL